MLLCTTTTVLPARTNSVDQKTLWSAGSKNTVFIGRIQGATAAHYLPAPYSKNASGGYYLCVRDDTGNLPPPPKRFFVYVIFFGLRTNKKKFQAKIVIVFGSFRLMVSIVSTG